MALSDPGPRCVCNSRAPQTGSRTLGLRPSFGRVEHNRHSTVLQPGPEPNVSDQLKCVASSIFGFRLMRTLGPGFNLPWGLSLSLGDFLIPAVVSYPR